MTETHTRYIEFLQAHKARKTVRIHSTSSNSELAATATSVVTLRYIQVKKMS